MSASEIIKELPKLSEAERRAVFDRLCDLAEGDERWEEIIDDERPRPKLEAFIEKARAEGSEPLVRVSRPKLSWEETELGLHSSRWPRSPVNGTTFIGSSWIPPVEASCPKHRPR